MEHPLIACIVGFFLYRTGSDEHSRHCLKCVLSSKGNTKQAVCSIHRNIAIAYCDAFSERRNCHHHAFTVNQQSTSSNNQSLLALLGLTRTPLDGTSQDGTMFSPQPTVHSLQQSGYLDRIVLMELHTSIAALPTFRSGFNSAVSVYPDGSLQVLLSGTPPAYPHLQGSVSKKRQLSLFRISKKRCKFYRFRWESKRAAMWKRGLLDCTERRLCLAWVGQAEKHHSWLVWKLVEPTVGRATPHSYSCRSTNGRRHIQQTVISWQMKASSLWQRQQIRWLILWDPFLPTVRRGQDKRSVTEHCGGAS